MKDEEFVKLGLLYGSATMRPSASARIIGPTATAWGFVRDMTMIEWTIIAAILGIIGAIGYWGYAESKREGFELKKADWKCSASHEVTTTTYVNMGDGKTIVLIPITTAHTVCDQWSRH